MEVVSQVIATMTAWLTGFLGIIVGGLQTVVGVFYDEGSITVLGALALMGLSIGLVTFVIAFVRGLIQR